MEISTEYDSADTITTKVPIKIGGTDTQPYFFIKWACADKRYRISASFKYLNTNYGLHINIIRDFNKIKAEDATDKIKYLLSLINKLSAKNITAGLNYSSYCDDAEETEIFFIEREYNGEINKVIVFFSLKHWSFNDYLQGI